LFVDFPQILKIAWFSKVRINTFDQLMLFIFLEIWLFLKKPGLSRGVGQPAANCANLAEGFFSMPQIAPTQPMDFLPCRRLRGARRGVGYVPASCADLAEGIFSLPQIVRAWSRGNLPFTLFFIDNFS
jgi:hypothetical protein